MGVETIPDNTNKNEHSQATVEDSKIATTEPDIIPGSLYRIFI